MKKLLSIAILATVVLSSCYKGRLKGEGQITTDTRTVSTFYTLESDGETTVVVYPSNTNKIVVSGYQNLVPAFETNVTGEKLTLKFKDKYVNVRNNNIRVTVYTTQLNMARINGSGNITISDSLNTKTMQAEINGSGSISFGKNSFDKLEMKINGSGNINAYQAISKYVDARISGSGDIYTTATETLIAKISGSGNINYSGNPQSVYTDISGSGKVRRN